MKVLYIATIAKKRNRLDGETIKCKLLENFLKEQNDIKVLVIDTDNWKKHIVKLVFLIIINYFKCNKIVISAADRGAHIILNFLEKIKTKKTIYYFVVGGSLYKNINKNKWDVNIYKNINTIYVEASELKDNLNSININNVENLNNFRKVEKFKNNYKKTKEIKFVFYGRIIKEKGIEESIKLINRLNNEGYNCTLDIYGQIKENYLKTLKPMFKNGIQYKGEIKPDNKKEYEILSYYDIFILPTEYSGECLPGALIDAYISGLAVIVSNWTYAKEYVKDGENGVIFKYKDYEDMYKKTKLMIDNDDIQKYKNESFEMSKRYMLQENLKDFKREILR